MMIARFVCDLDAVGLHVAAVGNDIHTRLGCPDKRLPKRRLRRIVGSDRMNAIHLNNEAQGAVKPVFFS